VSPRRDVTRERIEELLRALAARFRHPARLHLARGDGLVWRGLRGFTRDIDIAYDVDPKHDAAWIRVVRELKEALEVNIEQANPGDSIPLPPGSAERAESVGRYGQVEVFLFDPYAVALSKLARGHDQDIEDVRSLLRKRVIAADALRRHFDAILPEYEKRGLRADPDRFRAMLDLVAPKRAKRSRPTSPAAPRARRRRPRRG
jgi:uncharacterized nucleotidyltransferase DUF6036